MPKKYLKRAFTVAELIMTLFMLGAVSIAAINIVFKKDKIDEKIKSDTIDAVNYIVCNKDKKDLDEHGSGVMKGKNGAKICDFYIQPPGNSANPDREVKKQNVSYYVLPRIKTKEFFKITLVGGGAGGVDAQYGRGGAAGEVKVIYLPSLMYPLGRNTYKQKTKCGTSTCKECSDDKACTKCIDGYILKDGAVCEPNFKYRAILGEGGDLQKNGGRTSLLVVELETKDSSGTSEGKPLKVLGTAEGGLASVEKVTKQDYKGSSFGAGEVSSIENSEYGKGGEKQKAGTYGEVKIEW